MHATGETRRFRPFQRPPTTPTRHSDVYFRGGVARNKPAGKAGSGQEVAMRIVHIGCGAMFLLLSGVIAAPGAEQATALDRGAGTWKTWVISSGKDFRVPPPPDRGATEKEAVEVAKLAASRDKA